jgi:hypothetical protein
MISSMSPLEVARIANRLPVPGDASAIGAWQLVPSIVTVARPPTCSSTWLSGSVLHCVIVGKNWTSL